MFSAHCESVSATQTANLFFLLVSPHTTPHTTSPVWRLRKKKKKKNEAGRAGNTLTVPVAPESMFESWSFTFSTCYETASGNPDGTVGGQPVEYCSEGQKHSSHKAVCLGWKGMLTIFMVVKDELKKNKTNNQDSMKRLSCWTHCGHGHEGKTLLLLFLYQATTTSTFLLWRACSSGSRDPQAAQKQLPVLWFKAPLPAPLHTPQAPDSFLCQEHRMLCPRNQAAAVRATCSAPSASKHTRSCVRAKKKPWQLFDAWRTVTTL